MTEMDIRHPWLYIQQELTKRWRTQKDFAHILGKKVSEVNELIKGKRNITIQRDILLGTIFDDESQKRIHLQMEYDYATGNHSVDQEKLADIKIRKNLLKEKTTENKVESPKVKTREEEIHIPSIDEKKDKDTIKTNHIALEEESSTIQDTETPPTPKKDSPWVTPKDRKKEHEIFRNF